MKRLKWMLALASLVFVWTAGSARASGPISVSDTSYTVDYPNRMTFHLSAASAAPFSVITLAVHFPSNGLTTRLTARFTPSAQVDTSVGWQFQSLNGPGGYLPPGAKGDYSWHLEDNAGNKLDTPSQPFRVDDSRRQWQELQNQQVALFWYDGDASFGQAIFDKANKVLGAIQQDIGAALTSQVQIFIYGDRSDFLSVLSPGNHEWAGGTIDDTFGIVLIDASRSDLDYALSTTPHELTHLVIAQDLAGPYKDISMPLWMNEGLAVYHEFVPPQDETRFDDALRQGIQSDTLFRLRDLANNFPNDPSVVEMAYGESYSVVDFIIKQFGRDKLKQVMALFKSGSTADQAFQQVFGVDQDGLENLWRKSVGAQVKNYVKVPTETPGAVPTMGFSSAVTPGAATATPPAIALQATSAPSPNPAVTTQPTPQTGGGGGAGICGGLFGGVGLLAFGAWEWRRRYKRV